MELNRSVIPPDDTTLFSTSGMQKHKDLFKDPKLTGLTLSDSQTCFRTVDLNEVGDGNHALSFNMLGLFSFRSWSLLDGIRFWSGFFDRIGLVPDRVTGHPDKLDELRPLWSSVGFGHLLVPDVDCVWSDGDIGGYSTEMYRGGVEVGNIVNPLEDCLDCGFGLERLGLTLGLWSPPDEMTLLSESCGLLLDQGVIPGHSGRGYVLRRVMRRLIRLKSTWSHPVFVEERKRFERNQSRYLKLLDKHPGMDKQWWWSTHGIVLDECSPDM